MSAGHPVPPSPVLPELAPPVDELASAVLPVFEADEPVVAPDAPLVTSAPVLAPEPPVLAFAPVLAPDDPALDSEPVVEPAPAEPMPVVLLELFPVLLDPEPAEVDVEVDVEVEVDWDPVELALEPASPVESDAGDEDEPHAATASAAKALSSNRRLFIVRIPAKRFVDVRRQVRVFPSAVLVVSDFACRLFRPRVAG